MRKIYHLSFMTLGLFVFSGLFMITCQPASESDCLCPPEKEDKKTGQSSEVPKAESDPFYSVKPGRVNVRPVKKIDPSMSGFISGHRGYEELIMMEVAVGSPTTVDLHIVDHDSDWSRTDASHVTMYPDQAKMIVFGLRWVGAQEVLESLSGLLNIDQSSDRSELLKPLVALNKENTGLDPLVATEKVMNRRMLEFRILLRSAGQPDQ